MPAGGDPRTSATEIYRRKVRVKRCGKSAPGLWRHRFYDVNSIRSNTVGEHLADPAVLRRWLELVSNCESR